MCAWYLFLDDERYPPDGDTPWVVCRSVDDAMWYVKRHGPPVRMSLDHDLGHNRLTGMEFLRQLVDYLLDGASLPDGFEWYVHSQNPVGADNMRAYFQRYLDDGE